MSYNDESPPDNQKGQPSHKFISKRDMNAKIQISRSTSQQIPLQEIINSSVMDSNPTETSKDQNEKDNSQSRQIGPELLPKVSELKRKFTERSRQLSVFKAQFEKQKASMMDRIKIQEEKISMLEAKAPHRPSPEKAHEKLGFLEDISELQRRKAAILDEIKRLEKDVQDGRTENEDVKMQMRLLPHCGSIEALQLTKRQLEKEANAKISTYREQIAQSSKVIEESSGSLKVVTAEAESLQEENIKLFDKLSAIEKEAQTFRKERMSLLVQLQGMGAMVPIDQVRSSIELANKQHRSKTSEKEAELQDQIKQAEDEKASLSKELEERCSVIEQLHSKLTSLSSQMEEEKERSTERIKDIKASHKKAVQELREELRRDLEAAIGSAQRK